MPFNYQLNETVDSVIFIPCRQLHRRQQKSCRKGQAVFTYRSSQKNINARPELLRKPLKHKENNRMPANGTRSK